MKFDSLVQRIIELDDDPSPETQEEFDRVWDEALYLLITHAPHTQNYHKLKTDMSIKLAEICAQQKEMHHGRSKS